MRRPRILVADRGSRLPAQVTAALAAADPAPEVAVCAEPSDLDGTLVRDGPFHVLVAGTALATGTGLARLRSIGEDFPEVSVVLAFARRPQADLRELVRVGAVDLLQLPVDDDELAAAIARAVNMAREVVPEAGEDHAERADAEPPAPDRQPAPELPLPPEEDGGRVVTVVSATGSAGRTTVATNLAAHLVAVHRASVCLVDLDLRFGGVAAAMALHPETAISDLASTAPVDDRALAGLVTRHPSGVDVLAAPVDPAAADTVTAEGVGAIVAAAQRAYEWVVCDTPPALTELALGVVERSHHLVVVSLTDRASRRDLRAFLDRLRRMQVPASRVQLVFNRVDEHDPGTLPEAARIPEHPLAGPAASGGMPVTAGATGPAAMEMAGAFAAAFADFLPPPPPGPPPSAETETARAQRPAGRRRLRRRRD